MYRFIIDPGHGWLEVPRAELSELGILGTISRFSFEYGAMVYLEEDCDAPRFDAAYATRHGEAPNFEEVHQDPTPIRNYERFSA